MGQCGETITKTLCFTILIEGSVRHLPKGVSTERVLQTLDRTYFSILKGQSAEILYYKSEHCQILD